MPDKFIWVFLIETESADTYTVAFEEKPTKEELALVLPDLMGDEVEFIASVREFQVPLH